MSITLPKNCAKIVCFHVMPSAFDKFHHLLALNFVGLRHFHADFSLFHFSAMDSQQCHPFAQHLQACSIHLPVSLGCYFGTLLIVTLSFYFQP